jgi:hypothetical protein
MKNYQDFINEEAKLKGNIGVPEEKLKEIEAKAQQEKGIRIDDEARSRQIGGQLMGLVNKSRQLVFGGKSREECEEISEKLVDLTKYVINAEYGDILQNVELDIRLVPYGQVADELPEITEIDAEPSQRRQRELSQELEEEEKEEKKEESVDKKKSFLNNLFGSKPKKEKEDWLKSEEYKTGVDAVKLINAIGQGEAKNTKHILHSDEVKNGLRDIFGRNWEEIFKTWDETSKVADKLDWLIPIEYKSQMMADNPGGMAGAVKVFWPEADEAKESEEMGEEPGDDCPSCQGAEDILKNIEEGGDLNDNKEEIAELFSNGDPVIKAVGVDFPMLLHETVKGIYQLIGAAWLPIGDSLSNIKGIMKKDIDDLLKKFKTVKKIKEATIEELSEVIDSKKAKIVFDHYQFLKKEIKKAKIIKTATSSFEDEAEEFRYGSYLAEALRDFINTCPNVDRYPNIREYVWGDMCYMTRTKEGKKEFLNLFKGILEKTDKAKKQITEMISDIIDRIKEYEISQIDEPTYQERNIEEPEFEEPEEDEIEKLIKQKEEEPSEVDYSTLSRKQLDDVLNDALEKGDEKLLDVISKELKRRNESVMLQIYGEEIKKILKS